MPKCAGDAREVVYVPRMHIEQATVIVDDYDSAISFYVQALGFELVEDSPSLTNDGRAKRWVVVRPPGAATGLLLAQADGDANAQPLDRSSPGTSDCSFASTTSTPATAACSPAGSSS